MCLLSGVQCKWGNTALKQKKTDKNKGKKNKQNKEKDLTQGKYEKKTHQNNTRKLTKPQKPIPKKAKI